MTSAFVHAPVLLTETIEALKPRPGGHYVDATVGGGGHAEKILELSRPNGTLLAIDADPAALEAARARLTPFAGRVTFAQGYNDTLRNLATEYGFTTADGIIFDLGVSSPQLDEAERGFSFLHDASLDMRFGPDATVTASELLNTLPANELQDIFSRYGEEHFAGRIAARIAEARRRQPIRTTGELAGIIQAVQPSGRHQERIHPATRVFQALRIAVNDELDRLSAALPQAVDILATGGRLAVISFHSLEDRVVKQFFRREVSDCICPPALPVCRCDHRATIRVLTRRPITATAEEVAGNPRARSAKLRVAERLGPA